MTRDEKFKAILQRIPDLNIEFNETYVSLMVILGYVNKLKELGVIQFGSEVTQKGKDLVAICEEYCWQPTDMDIYNFVNVSAIDKEDRADLAAYLLCMRDDPEEFINQIKKFKAGNDTDNFSKN